jgi:hypothetical protein
VPVDVPTLPVHGRIPRQRGGDATA